MSQYHYVSIVILQNFANDNRILWVPHKGNGRTWSLTDGSTARYGAFSENSSDVKVTLSKLEGEAAQDVRYNVIRVRRWDKPVMHLRDRRFLCTFLLVQSPRISRVKRRVIGKQWEYVEDKDLFWRMIKDFRESTETGLQKYLQIRCFSDDSLSPELTFLQWMVEIGLEISRIRLSYDIDFLIGEEPCLRQDLCDSVVMPITNAMILQLSRSSDLRPLYSQVWYDK